MSYIRNLVSKAAIKQGQSKMMVVIDCSHMSQADFTAAEGFHAMLEDFKSRHQQVYWQAANQGVVATLRAIVGEDLKVISGPVELASNRQQSPKSGPGTFTEMVTIKEEIQEQTSSSSQPGLRFIVSPPGQKM